METESVLSNQFELELENDIVTVSKVQVALRATARHLSAQLSELALKAETDEPEGLYALMQQTAKALLDHAAHWSHVLASSHTIDSRDAAEELFIQLSDRERRKFSVETLSNVDGVIQRQPIPLPDADEKPAYIVVTLLLGTEDDRPLFGELRSADELSQVLEKIHTLRAPYLMVFELLWTPQDVMDVLTAEDLATQFNDLIPIVP
jgi:uncharacterized membrane protein